TYWNGRDQSLSEASGFRPRFGASTPPRENLLPDSGVRSAADICPLHRPPGKASLLLSAIHRKSTSPRLRIRGYADLDQKSCARLISARAKTVSWAQVIGGAAAWVEV